MQNGFHYEKSANTIGCSRFIFFHLYQTYSQRSFVVIAVAASRCCLSSF